MTTRWSSLALLREGLRGHRGWRPAWAKAAPQPAYDGEIIVGGGHGLATAYYLAKNHGVRRVAGLKKGWIGGGNTGRNTTAVRSNCFYPESWQAGAARHPDVAAFAELLVQVAASSA